MLTTSSCAQLLLHPCTPADCPSPVVAGSAARRLPLQLYVLAATATPAASPAERATLRMALLMPDTGLLATPLYTKRLCNVPLAQALLTPGQMMAGQVMVK